MDLKHLSVHEQTVELDACVQCGGVFLDYFDGEPAAIAAELRDSARKGAAKLDLPVTCTDCDVAMELQSYLETGPDMFRCTACMAAFVTPDQVDALARFTMPNEEPKERGWVQILKAWLD